MSMSRSDRGHLAKQMTFVELEIGSTSNHIKVLVINEPLGTVSDSAQPQNSRPKHAL